MAVQFPSSSLSTVSQMCSVQSECSFRRCRLSSSLADYFISLPISITSPFLCWPSFLLIAHSTFVKLEAQAASRCHRRLPRLLLLLPISLSAVQRNLCLNDSNDRIDLPLFRQLAAAATTAAHRRLTPLPLILFLFIFPPLFLSLLAFIPRLLSTVCTFSFQPIFALAILVEGEQIGKRNERNAGQERERERKGKRKSPIESGVRLWRM